MSAWDTETDGHLSVVSVLDRWTVLTGDHAPAVVSLQDKSEGYMIPQTVTFSLRARLNEHPGLVLIHLTLNASRGRSRTSET